MKVNRFLNAFFISLSIVFLATDAFSLNRHRYHTSLTRMDYNADEKLFEISIKLFLHDLVPVLEKKFRSRINLEKTSEVDNLILKYLNQEFALKDKTGAAKELKWVGKEIDVDSVWIYLEAESGESLEGYSLQNTIFFESFREQTNLVICRFEGKKADLVFKPGDRIKEITANKPKKEN